MIEIIIDSSFLACPVNGSEERYQEYAMRLVSLHSIAQRQIVSLLTSGKTFEVLELTGTRPPYGGSPADSYIGTRDVTSLFFSVVDRARSVDDYTRIIEVLLDNPSATPNEHLSNRSSELVVDYYRTLSQWAIWCMEMEGTQPGAASLHFDAPILTEGIGTIQRVLNTGTAVDIETEDDGFRTPIPIEYALESPHTSSVDKLSEILDPVRIWKLGAFGTALEVRIAQRREDEPHAWWNEDLRFSFHPDFENSVRQLGFGHEPGKIRRLLRACVDTILARRMAATHKLREDRSGAAPQIMRIRDGAKAWRRDIDREYHLHYWKSGSHIELAVVVTHDDYSLPMT